jgi:hypothetical protein
MQTKIISKLHNLQKDTLNVKTTINLKMEGYKKMYYANNNQKKAKRPYFY